MSAFFNLRLEGLRLAPTAFGGDYESEKKQGPARFDEIISKQDPHNVIFGAFSNGILVGCVGLVREKGIKSEHKALIWGMFVKANFQGQGIGRQLLEKAILHGKSLKVIQMIHLSVESNNSAAKTFYESCGFQKWGQEPKALLIDGVFYDEDQMAIQI